MNSKYLIRMALGHSPLTLPLFPLLSPDIRNRNLSVGTGTEVCIEAFPRSANSFFCWYFRRANPERTVAHHLHIPANILASVRRQLPTLVLVRPPEDAIVSLMVGFDGRVDVANLVRNYIHFHRRILPVAGDCVISDFATTTQDPAAVIRGANAKFGTRFAATLPDGVTVDDFTSHAAEAAERRTGGTTNISLLTAPDHRKDERKAKYRTAVQTSPRLDEARRLYFRFLEHPSRVG